MKTGTGRPVADPQSTGADPAVARRVVPIRAGQGTPAERSDGRGAEPTLVDALPTAAQDSVRMRSLLAGALQALVGPRGVEPSCSWACVCSGPPRISTGAHSRQSRPAPPTTRRAQRPAMRPLCLFARGADDTTLLLVARRSVSW